MKQVLGIVFFFLLFLSTVLLNVKVSALRNEIRKVGNEIDMLEREKTYLENYIQSNLDLKKIEKEALKMGLTYPKNVVEFRVYDGKISEISKEKYYASSLEK
uniref:Cell division protein FtsL n=1 Tax=Dictyoglomus thermophilum TaxID=14 RepID=A0A7C3PTN7_DICTH